MQLAAMAVSHCNKPTARSGVFCGVCRKAISAEFGVVSQILSQVAWDGCMTEVLEMEEFPPSQVVSDQQLRKDVLGSG
jgi:hypothetical protein